MMTLDIGQTEHARENDRRCNALSPPVCCCIFFVCEMILNSKSSQGIKALNWLAYKKNNRKTFFLVKNTGFKLSWHHVDNVNWEKVGQPGHFKVNLPMSSSDSRKQFREL